MFKIDLAKHGLRKMMSDASQDVEISKFIDDARPFLDENRFILGTFERGVTFYRQQIRALNLVYTLVMARNSDGTPKIPSGSRMAIIGGGAFGVTAAAAATYAGFRVTLLERQQNLMHLQRGCDTRWLHPRFYDWPALESESHLARLPILDWVASPAGQVALDIERQFLDLVRRKNGELKYILEVSTVNVGKPRNNVYEVTYKRGTGQDIIPCESVIYAVGFGNEFGQNEPYWRNDRLGQSELDFMGSKKVKYVVSGVGDGGLVDLFRLTIRDFRHERISTEMFGPPDKPLLAKLRELSKTATPEPGWLYDQFKAIEDAEADGIAGAMEKLKSRRRVDTDVTLNGREDSLRISLSLYRISMGNALLAYCLYRIGAFDYQEGSIDANYKGATLTNLLKKKPKWLAGAKLIVRHGTNREKVLQDIGFDEDAITFLKERATVRDSGLPIYPAGWWGRYTVPQPVFGKGAAPAPVEFVPPALMTHATTFVSTLGNILEFLIDKKPSDGTGGKQFRVALHRLARFDGGEVFQQITPYAGRIASRGGIGRLFPVRSGIVGLACKTGRLVVVRKADEEAFHKIWDLTDLKPSGAKPIKPYVDSILACPFFAPQRKPDYEHVSLVLFADSAEMNFFDDEVLGTISAACRGFVTLMESLHLSGVLKPIPTFYPGFEIRRDAALDGVVRELGQLGVRFESAADRGWKKGLTFQTLDSLDLELERFTTFRHF